MGKGTSVDEGQEVWFLSFSKYSSLVLNVHLCVCVCVLAGMLGYGVKVSLCKYAEHGGPRTGAEGEHGVAELIYLMTERLISPQP